MKYLLDTNVIINHLRGKKAIDLAFIKNGSSVSIISKAELLFGAYKSEKSKNNLKKVFAMLKDLQIKTTSLTDEVIKTYAKTKASLEKEGKKIDEFDLLIAATALSFKLTLVTSNIKHFQRIPKLKIVKF